jgi:hypothetical protein
MMSAWPAAELDPIRKMRILAASITGTAVAETVIAGPFERVWDVASDLETVLPHLIRDFRTVQVSPGEGDRLVLLARGHLGQRARFDVVLRPGWCWMQSRFLLGGMAAAPHPDGTTVAFLGGLRLPGTRALQPLINAAGAPMAASALRRLADRVQQT